jgi:hypothetical protein
MKPPLYIPQWAAENGNYAIKPPTHDSDDLNAANVPTLIELKGPTPCLSEGAAGVGSGSGIGSSSASGPSSLESADEPHVDLCAPTLRNSTAELPNINMNMNMNIDFLYQVGEERPYFAYSISILSFY